MNKLFLKAALTIGITSMAATNTIYADDLDDDLKSLHGSYGMNFSQTCVLTPIQPPPSTGFDEETSTLLTDAEIVSAVSNGIVHFKKDGEVTIEEGVLTEIFDNRVMAGDKPINAGNNYSCEGTYQLADNGKLSTDLVCHVHIPVPGVEITIAPFKLQGYVNENQKFINLTALDGNIQKFQLSVQGQIVEERQRICLQTLSMGKLPRQDED